MGGQFGVGDLNPLTNRLRRADEDLDDAVVRIARLGVGRHGILNPTSASLVGLLWRDWSGTVAEQAARCIQLAAAVADVARDYRATDSSIAGYPSGADAPTLTAVRDRWAVMAAVNLSEGPLMADPAEAFAGMVVTSHHLSIDIDNLAHTIAGSPATVEWWGAAADAAFAAVRDLSRDVWAAATAIDALRDVFAAYGDTVWPRSGRPMSTIRFLIGVDPGRDLAEQARDADTGLRAGVAAWAAPHHAAIATVGDEPADDGRHVDRTQRVAVPTAAITGRDQPAPEHVGSLMADRRLSADSYRVAFGDTLWAIARRTLGDARRWRDIFDLNDGRRQRDGRALTDPRLILPGWRLKLPPIETRPAPTTVPQPAHTSVNPPAPSAATRRPTPPTATPNAAPALPPAPRAADRPARNGESAWPLVDVAVGATAFGAGVGWVAGRRRRRPGTAISGAPSPEGSRAAVSDLQTGTVGTAEHSPHDPATSPPPRVLRSPRDVTARALPASCSPSPPADDAVRPRADDPRQPIHPPSANDTVPRWPNDWNPIGTGLIGPGAHAAGRSILVSALTTSPPPGTPRTSRVIATAAAMTLLLPDRPVPADTIARLTIVGDLTEALNRLDREILTRSRTTKGTDANTPDSDSHAAEGSGSWPPLLLIAEPPPPADRIRLAAILLQGTALGIDAVILGPWPAGTSITVDDNGHTPSPDRSDPDAARRNLTVTDPDTARTILRSLAFAPPQDPGDPAPTAAPDTRPPGAPNGRPSSAVSDGDSGERIRESAGPGADSGRPSTTPISPTRETLSNAVEGDRPTRGQLGAVSYGRPSRTRVDVQVLGTTPHLADPPSDIAAPPWRPQARELLAYLICHPRGVAEHILFEDVLGDVPGSKVRSRMNTYVYSLHQQLRAVGGPGTYLTHTAHGHIMIDPDRIDSDLWRLHQHLHDAANASDTCARITALQAAVAAYTGTLATDHDYFWIPPIREATRRQAIDAHVALADLLADSDPAAAAIVTEQAIGHDPYNETLYQQAMRLRAKRAEFAAVVALRNRLVRALADIGVTPTSDTMRLADDLLADPARHNR